MTSGIRAIVAAGLVLAINAPAVAGEVQRLNNKAGLNVTYNTESGRYCMTTHSGAAAKRLGLRVHTKECRTKDGWAREGLTLAHNNSSDAQQLASAD
jgi:hypothetical protein